MGRLLSNKVVLGIVGLAAIAIVAVVVVYATGVIDIGGDGPGSGGGSGSAQDYLLEDAETVIVQNVAKILETEFLDGIPQQMLRATVLNVPSGSAVDLEDPDEWKDEWRDGFANNLYDFVGEAISLEEITYAMWQQLPQDDGIILSGRFNFEDIRAELEDADWEDSEYRGFEVWGDRGVALLEERGLFVVGRRGFVEEFLKALERDGFADDENRLKQALGKMGNVLVLHGDASCSQGLFFPTSELKRCEGSVDAVVGGSPFESKVSGAYVFRNESSAESGRDDIDDAIVDESGYDADADEIDVSGVVVTYQATIHQDYKYEAPTRVPPTAPATPTNPPPPTQQQYSSNDLYQVAQELLRCGEFNGTPTFVNILVRHDWDYHRATISILDDNTEDQILLAHRRECG